jgi:hypothetical protein
VDYYDDESHSSKGGISYQTNLVVLPGYMGHIGDVVRGYCTRRDVRMFGDRVAGLWQNGHSCTFPAEQADWLVREYRLWIEGNQRSLG